MGGGSLVDELVDVGSVDDEDVDEPSVVGGTADDDDEDVDDCGEDVGEESEESPPQASIEEAITTTRP